MSTTEAHAHAAHRAEEGPEGEPIGFGPYLRFLAPRVEEEER